MTNQLKIHKPPITDLWLLVDEEQTIHLGMRRAWRWLDAEHPSHAHPAPQPASAHFAAADARQTCCARQQAPCAA